ncbi:MAG: hypothetical protein IJK31_02830 [Ruminococcus sp.]|nr:hypothetical protein [Ruminococcus sp.]
MNNLKLFEAITMIDDDLVAEADVKEETQNNISSLYDEGRGIAAGVDVYRKNRLFRVAAAAAALLLIVGAGSGGMYLMKGHDKAKQDSMNEEVVPAVPTEKVLPSSEQPTEEAEEPTFSTESTSPAVTTKKARLNDEKITVTNTIATTITVRQTAGIVTTTTKAGKTAAAVTTKATALSEEKTTTAAAEKTTLPPVDRTEETPDITPEIPDGKRMMTKDDIKKLSSIGMKLTVADFDKFIGTDIGSGIYIMKYEIEDIDDEYLLVGSDGLSQEPIYVKLRRYDGTEIDIRTEEFRKMIGAAEEKTEAALPETESRRRITLDDLKQLYARRSELNIADFEYYIGVDIGSGICVMKYEIADIDDKYLLVGSDGLSQRPIYVRLRCSDRTSIDISSEEFIKAVEAAEG